MRLGELARGAFLLCGLLWAVEPLQAEVGPLPQGAELQAARKDWAIPGVVRAPRSLTDLPGAAAKRGERGGADEAPGRLETLDEVMQRDGFAQVIVELEVESAAAPGLDIAEQRRRQQGIAQAQERVLNALAQRSRGRPVPAAARRFEFLPMFAQRVDADELDLLRQLPEVRAVHPDLVMEPALAASTTLIGATQAQTQYGLDGNGAMVAVLDTGVDATHPFLSPRVLDEACFSGGNGQVTSLCPNQQPSQFGPGAAAPCANGCEHGTHVAGIAAGRGPDFSGVAPGAGIMAIQVFSDFCGGGGCISAFTSDIIAGLEYVYSRRGDFQIASANMSLGGGLYESYCDTGPYKAAIDALRQAGIATVVANGNNGQRYLWSSPGCVSSAVSVASSTKNDEVSSFSNTTAFTDLIAPGSDIASSIPGGGFANFSGTSMAAPHVAGAFALLRQGCGSSCSVDQLEWALKSRGVPLLDQRSANVGVRSPRIDIPAALNDLYSSAGLLSVLPVRSVQLSGVQFEAPFGHSRDISLLLGNDGGRPLRWQAFVNAPWWRTGANEGVLDPGNYQTLSLSNAAVARVLPPGTFRATVTVDNLTGQRGNAQRPLSFLVAGDFPANDAFADALQLSGARVEQQGNGRVASFEAGEPDHAGEVASRSLWYRWTAPAGGPVIVDVGNWNTFAVAVYSGSSLDALTPVSNNKSGAYLASRLSFVATAGQEYRIAVDNVAGVQWDFLLRIAQGAPANDAFADAQLITQLGGSVLSGDNFHATRETGEPDTSGTQSCNSVWWRFTPGSSTKLQLRASGSISAWLALYTGNAVDSLSEVTVERIQNGEVFLTPQSGTTYYAAVCGRWGSSGTFSLSLYPAPSNDHFAQASTIAAGGGRVERNTRAASAEQDEPAHAGIPARRSVWFAWTPAASGQTTIDTFGSSFDTVLAVYTGSALNQLTPIAANDDAGSLQSQVSFAVSGGETYRIAADGYYGSSGDLVLTVSPAAAPPSNDAFADAASLTSDTPVAGNNAGATAETGEPRPTCCSAVENSVWWRWTATQSGAVTVDSRSSSFATETEVFTGDSVDALTWVAGEARFYGSELPFNAVAGTTYHIRVDGYLGQAGPIQILLNTQKPANDAFASRTLLSGMQGTTSGNNRNANVETDEPAHGGQTATKSVWWNWTAPEPGWLSVTTAGSGFDTRLAIYAGSSLGALNLLGQNNDISGSTGSLVTVPVEQGESYPIAIDGAGQGDVQLNYMLFPASIFSGGFED